MPPPGCMLLQLWPLSPVAPVGHNLRRVDLTAAGPFRQFMLADGVFSRCETVGLTQQKAAQQEWRQRIHSGCFQAKALHPGEVGSGPRCLRMPVDWA